MKYKLTFLFIFFLISSCSEKSEPQCYSELIENSRENYLIGDYNQAISLAYKALDNKSFPLTSDINYFLNLCISKNENLLCEKVCETLFKGGAPLSYIEQFLSQEKFLEFKNNSSLYRAEFESNFDPDLRKMYIELTNSDSIFTNNYHKWRIGELKLSEEQLINGAIDILMKLNQFNSKYGFPSESNVGYFVENGELISEYEILLLHTYQRGELIFYDQLDSLYCNGLIDADLKYDLRTNRGYGNSTGIKDEMKIRYKKFNKF